MTQLLAISLIGKTLNSKYHHKKIKSRTDANIGQGNVYISMVQNRKGNGFTYYEKKPKEVNFFYAWLFQLPVALPSGHIP